MLPNEPDALVAGADGADEAYDTGRLRDQANLNKILDDRRRKLDILLIDKNYSPDSANSKLSMSGTTDIGLSVFVVSLIIIVFVLMYFYFASSRRKVKLKKHII